MEELMWALKPQEFPDIRPKGRPIAQAADIDYDWLRPFREAVR